MLNLPQRPSEGNTAIQTDACTTATTKQELPLRGNRPRPISPVAEQCLTGPVGRSRTDGATDPEPIYHLPQVYAEFLSTFSWDWFATIAPADCPHPESLDKLFGLFIHNINREVYGTNYWKDKRKGVYYAVATERQQRFAPHHHAIIGGIPDYVNPLKWRNWLYSHSTMSKIEPYEKDKGAEYYLSKSSYAFKHGEIDLSKTLVYEQEGSRICAKRMQETYMRSVATLTKPDLSQFNW